MTCHTDIWLALARSDRDYEMRTQRCAIKQTCFTCAPQPLIRLIPLFHRNREVSVLTSRGSNQLSVEEDVKMDEKTELMNEFLFELCG